MGGQLVVRRCILAVREDWSFLVLLKSSCLMNRFRVLVNVFKRLFLAGCRGLLGEVLLQWLGAQGTSAVTYFCSSLIAHALNPLYLLLPLITDLSLNTTSLAAISRSPCSTAPKLLPQRPQELLIRLIFPQFIIFNGVYIVILTHCILVKLRYMRLTLYFGTSKSFMHCLLWLHVRCRSLWLFSMMIQLSQFLLDTSDPVDHSSITLFHTLWNPLSRYSLVDLHGVLIQFDEMGFIVEAIVAIAIIGGR